MVTNQPSPGDEPIAPTITPGVPAPADARQRDAANVQNLTREKGAAEREEDVVTEASIQSFPASDPPGWIPVRL